MAVYEADYDKLNTYNYTGNVKDNTEEAREIARQVAFSSAQGSEVVTGYEQAEKIIRHTGVMDVFDGVAKVNIKEEMNIVWDNSHDKRYDAGLAALNTELLATSERELVKFDFSDEYLNKRLNIIATSNGYEGIEYFNGQKADSLVSQKAFVLRLDEKGQKYKETIDLNELKELKSKNSLSALDLLRFQHDSIFAQERVAAENAKMVNDYIRNTKSLAESGILKMSSARIQQEISKGTEGRFKNFIEQYKGGNNEKAAKKILEGIQKTIFLNEEGKKLKKIRRKPLRNIRRTLSDTIGDSEVYQGYKVTRQSKVAIETAISVSMSINKTYHKINRDRLQNKIEKGNKKAMDTFNKLYGEKGRITRRDNAIEKFHEQVKSKFDIKTRFNNAKFNNTEKKAKKELLKAQKKALKNRRKSPLRNKLEKLAKLGKRGVFKVFSGIYSSFSSIKRYIAIGAFAIIASGVIMGVIGEILVWSASFPPYIIGTILDAFNKENDYKHNQFIENGMSQVCEDSGYTYLKDKFGEGAACGILAVLFGENQYSPYLLRDYDNTIRAGLGNWNEDGIKRLERWDQANGNNYDSDDALTAFNAQLSFIVYDIENNYPELYAALCAVEEKHNYDDYPNSERAAEAANLFASYCQVSEGNNYTDTAQSIVDDRCPDEEPETSPGGVQPPINDRVYE